MNRRARPAPERRTGSRTRGTRLLKVVTAGRLGFPHARQVLRIQRKRRRIGTRRWQTETVYAITDLQAHQASPDELATWGRGHWTIEVRHEALRSGRG